MQDKKTKNYRISLILLKPQQIPLYTIIKNNNSDGQPYIKAVDPIIVEGNLEMITFSEDRIYKANLKDAQTEDKILYDNKEEYKEEIKQIKKEISKY